MRRIIQTALAVFLLILTASSVFADQPPKALVDQLVQSTPGRINISYHSGTGKVRFISVEPGNSIPNVAAIAATAAPADAAASFLSVYGPLFGISDPAKELRMKRQKRADRGRSFMRYQQRYKNVPIFGGELIVQMDAKNNVISAHGKVSPDVTLDTTPAIDAASATNTAVNLVAKQYNIDPSNLVTSTPELWIYNPVLLGHEINKNFLVWRIEVRADNMSDVDELVLVDAQIGFIALHFNQVPNAKNRVIYNNYDNYAYGLPGNGPVRLEGGAATGDSDADKAYTYTGYTYDFYLTYHGRDSIDNAGMPIVSTVHYCPNSSCPGTPYQNAGWNGQYNQMVYGTGFASALDVVGHELTHGVTQHESSLFYYMQSGAINESLSDVWGELIQQTYEPPALANRWIMGDMLPLGFQRSMSDPTVYNDPDKMTSSLYRCGTADQGGVHHNSGVDNKAAFLMVDGGAVAGKPAVTGIGITKTSKIYYEAQTNLLISSSDYADLYDILQLACNNLIGTSGITISDCQQVKNAADAVEMNLQPTNCSMCPAGQMPVDLFFDSFDANLGNWTHSYMVGGDAWSRQLWSGSDYLIWGSDLPYASASYMLMNNPLAVPSNAYFQFDHQFQFEQDLANYDGGMVAYSTDGGASWTNADGLFNMDGYNGAIYLLGSNPYAGYSAFVGSSGSWVTSRLDLSPLIGQNALFSFWIGTDSSNIFGSPLGWWIDNVRIYQCSSTVPVMITTSPAGQQVIVDGIGYIAPQSFTWPQGTLHTISASSPPTGTSGTRYVYSSWSDGEAQSHSIVTPASATTYTANFTPEYLLTTNIVPPASGSVTPDCVGGCWYGSGSSISLSPTPSDSNTFKSWSGDVSSLDAPIQITINGPKTINANFDSTTVTGTVRIVRTPPVYYTTIPLAYAAAVNNDVIQLQATAYAGAHTFDRTDIPGLTVTLKGGYNATYSDNTGFTTVASPLTIKTGTITLDNIVIE